MSLHASISPKNGAKVHSMYMRRHSVVECNSDMSTTSRMRSLQLVAALVQPVPPDEYAIIVRQLPGSILFVKGDYFHSSLFT